MLVKLLPPQLQCYELLFCKEQHWAVGIDQTGGTASRDCSCLDINEYRAQRWSMQSDSFPLPLLNIDSPYIV